MSGKLQREHEDSPVTSALGRLGQEDWGLGISWAAQLSVCVRTNNPAKTLSFGVLCVTVIGTMTGSSLDRRGFILCSQLTKANQTEGVYVGP